MRNLGWRERARTSGSFVPKPLGAHATGISGFWFLAKSNSSANE